MLLYKFSYSKIKETDAKYFMRYKTGQKVSQLFIMLPQIARFLNEFQATHYISVSK